MGWGLESAFRASCPHAFKAHRLRTIAKNALTHGNPRGGFLCILSSFFLESFIGSGVPARDSVPGQSKYLIRKTLRWLTASPNRFALGSVLWSTGRAYRAAEASEVWCYLLERRGQLLRGCALCNVLLRGQSDDSEG